MAQYGVSFAAKLLEKGDYPEALDAASKAIAQEADNPEHFFDRAQAQAGLGHGLEALDDFEEALRLDEEAQVLDIDILDDAYFDALLAAARASNDDEMLERYRRTFPSGRHLDDARDWAKRMRGELKSEFVKRTLDDV